MVDPIDLQYSVVGYYVYIEDGKCVYCDPYRDVNVFFVPSSERNNSSINFILF